MFSNRAQCSVALFNVLIGCLAQKEFMMNTKRTIAVVRTALVIASVAAGLQSSIKRANADTSQQSITGVPRVEQMGVNPDGSCRKETSW